MVQYSEAFKQRMVQKLSLPGAMSACELALEVGVSQASLSRWKREAGKLETMTKQDQSNEPRGTTTDKRPQDWSPEEKIQVLAETAAMPETELGGYLRRKGLYEATLKQWREAVTNALGKPVAKARKSREQKAAEKQIRKLEWELRRKDAALAETAALLVLKKKVQAIWGDGDDGTTGRNG